MPEGTRIQTPWMTAMGFTLETPMAVMEQYQTISPPTETYLAAVRGETFTPVMVQKAIETEELKTGRALGSTDIANQISFLLQVLQKLGLLGGVNIAGLSTGIGNIGTGLTTIAGSIKLPSKRGSKKIYWSGGVPNV